MNPALIVRGRYSGQTFVPDEPLPIAEGTAELIITPRVPAENSNGLGVLAFLDTLPASARTVEDWSREDAAFRERRDEWDR